MRASLAARLGSDIVSLHAAHGGDINQCFRIELADHRRLFVKTHASPPRGMYDAEAHGLAWLAEARALRVPKVIFADDACLVMEAIETGRPARDFDETLGVGLAKLHRFGAASFGLERSNYIALLPQDNAARPTWARFYAEQRIGAQTSLARSKQRIDAALARRLERLADTLESRLGPEEPPARLHGDLWGGNLLCDSNGAPCLIDPAVYAGHREIDLAMMRLFGGFGERVFAAYEAAFPLAPDHAERVALYQLYPLLVHVNLFGGSYVSQVERVVNRYA
ncbi:MAG TPA: fructosamine kinase family protein [Polyangiales bacterium]|nr:fructosamine kinase family protein [Polyangiales bacterium]